MNDLTIEVPNEIGGEATAVATEITTGEWEVKLDGQAIGIVWMDGRSDYRYSTPYSACEDDEIPYTLDDAIRGLVRHWWDDQHYANS